MPSAIAEAPATMPEFCNTVYPEQRVTLPLIREGTQVSGKKILPAYREVKFIPRKVGEKEEGQKTVPIIHGFYTPIDEEELAALRAVCARGYCPATEVDADEQRAYAILRRKQEQQAAAAHAGRPGERGRA